MPDSFHRFDYFCCLWGSVYFQDMNVCAHEYIIKFLVSELAALTFSREGCTNNFGPHKIFSPILIKLSIILKK